MKWTKEHKWALLLEHNKESIADLDLHIIPYKGGLEWMYKLLRCEYVEHLTPINYFPPEFTAYPIDEAPHSDIWIDEEGKLDGAPPTFPIYDEEGCLVDVIHGNMLFINGDNDTGESHGLTRTEAVCLAYWVMSIICVQTKFTCIHDVVELKAFTLRRH